MSPPLEYYRFEYIQTFVTIEMEWRRCSTIRLDGGFSRFLLFPVFGILFHVKIGSVQNVARDIPESLG